MITPLCFATLLCSSSLLAETGPSASASTVPVGSAAPATSKPSPDKIPYDGGRVPAGYRVDSSPSYPVIAIGGVVTGIGLAVLLAANSQRDSGCEPDDEGCDSRNMKLVGKMTIGGGVMAVGVVTAVVGLVVRREYLVRDAAENDEPTKRKPPRERQSERSRVMFQIGPQGPGQIGVGVSGVF